MGSPPTAARTASGAADRFSRAGVPGRRLTVLMLAGALAVAAFLRFYRLDALPPGLWHDEAFNGRDALRVLSGEFPVIFEANHGRQPLFIYLQALAVAVLGATPGALRATAALVGVLTVLSVYFLARDMESDDDRGRRAGLLAAGLLAVMPWHVHFSRYGLRAILFPLLVCWFLFFLWRALSGGRWRDYAAAGVALAGAFYTYIVAVLLPPLVAIAVALYLRARPRPRRVVGGTALSLGLALVLLTPLLLFYLDHPGMAFGRPSDVSLFNASRTEEGLLAAGLGNLVAAVGMFFWAGSTNWRHNLAGWPLLDPLSGALLVAGTAIALIQWRRRDHQLLLLAGGVLLLPSVLSSEGLPHAKYALGMAPVVAVLMARGAARAIEMADALLDRAAQRGAFPPVPVVPAEAPPEMKSQRLGARPSRPQAGRRPALPGELRRGGPVFATAYLVLLAVVGAATSYRYFVAWSGAPEVYFAYESDVRAAAEVLRQATAGVPNLRAIWAHVGDPDQVVNLRFLAPEIGEKVVAVGHQNELGPLPAALPPLLYLVPASQRFVPPDLDALLGVSPLLGPPTPLGEPAFRAFLLDGAPVPAPSYSPSIPLDARLGQAAELRGASVAPAPGEEERAALVSLLWRPLEDQGPEARLFFHLLDGSGRPRGQAHFSARPQYRWDPAALASRGLVSWFLVPLDAAAPPGEYRVVVGLSAALGGAALPVEAPNTPLLVNRVLLGAISLGPSPTLPSPRSLAMERTSTKEIAPGLQLLGYRLDRHQALPGEMVSLSLFWQALRPGLPDYHVAAWLAAEDGTTDGAPAPPAGDAYPTSRWRRGEIVEERRDLRLPARIPPGDAEILVAVLPRKDGQPLPVARLDVRERPRSFALPNLACCPLGARLGSLATLEAFHLDTPPAERGLWRIRAGDTATATLYWRARDETDLSYKVFLHLVSEQGTVVAQHDSPPALGDSPTTSWVRDQVVADQHPLALPPALAPGRYRLLAGLYDESTGRRLNTDSPGDAVELATILIGVP